jgi:hypothetical protein
MGPPPFNFVCQPVYAPNKTCLFNRTPRTPDLNRSPAFGTASQQHLCAFALACCLGIHRKTSRFRKLAVPLLQLSLGHTTTLDESGSRGCARAFGQSHNIRIKPTYGSHFSLSLSSVRFNGCQKSTRWKGSRVRLNTFYGRFRMGDTD